MTPLCINQPKYAVVSVPQLLELSSHPVYVSSLCWLSHSKVPWWICLPRVSHSLTFDCYGDINLQSIIFSLSYLIICQFSGWVFCLGGKGSTDVWEMLLYKQRDQSAADHWLLPMDHSSGTTDLSCLWLTKTPQSLKLQYSNLTFLQPGTDVLLLSCLWGWPGNSHSKDQACKGIGLWFC